MNLQCSIQVLNSSEAADLPLSASNRGVGYPVNTYVYEVVKKLAREAGDEVASAALTLMQQGRVVEIDLALALAATRYALPLADSLIYATAQLHAAELWTQDAHFDRLPGVRYFAKP